MSRRLAQILGIGVGLVAIFGLFAGGGQLWGIANTDWIMDMVSIATAGALLYAGFGTRDSQISAYIVLSIGVIYLGMGLLAMLSPTLFGLAPSALPGIEVTFLVIGGALGIMIATVDNSQHHSAAHPA